MENITPRKGHPRALYILFFTEMWERFGYYLMVGIFLLYLIGPAIHGGKAFDTATATDIVGSYLALVYLTPFIGGLLADRFLGYRRSIIIGGILMALGYFGLAFPGDMAMYISLALIIIGNGFFKPNISTLLGNIYNAEDLRPKKDVAYNIFYMGINIGAFFCNFVAAVLRHKYGWGYAFAAAGVGMVIGLITFIIGMRDVEIKKSDVVKPAQKEDMPLSKVFGYVFIPAIVFAIIGWHIKGWTGHSIFGKVSNDAFFFACIPIIIFYLGILFKASKEDKRGLGALLAFFAASIVFWVIYNQNSTALTIWADQYTKRDMPKAMENVAKPLDILQTVTLDSSTIARIDNHFVQQSITADMVGTIDSTMKMDTTTKKMYPVYAVTIHSKKDNSYIGRGIFDAVSDQKNLKEERQDAFDDTKPGKTLNILSTDPYLENLPKDKWPQKGEKLSLFSPELYQSANPIDIVILTPLILGILGFFAARKRAASTVGKVAMGMIIAGLSSLLMVFAANSCDIYLDKTSMGWLLGTYAIFSAGELLISPLGLSMVSKLSPPRLTALMMGAWFLINSMAGKIAGMMAGYWDNFQNKGSYFMILFVASLVAAAIIFMMSKWLSAVVKEKTGMK